MRHTVSTTVFPHETLMITIARRAAVQQGTGTPVWVRLTSDDRAGWTERRPCRYADANGSGRCRRHGD